ncbi:MAG: hypothetical protein LKI32_01705 [Lachnospiraceae bacterium]|jgi:Tfp pilus assembly protein PilF|nr:hypothetical protein [Lachnospiraceae bacterium]MCI1656258.1 hypothetical protein [Lachnospiraceae bacterium]MCI2194740.1 hypothetical protein [Lachnospiraceae bacterium]HAD20257.1 hypothetical protein [Lachnospiraceae bacterium]
MKCCYCGAELDTSNFCPRCGNDVRIWKKTQFISNYLYNQGLEKAKKRELSYAAQALTLSLQYNKRNTDARNLLGVVYMEMGELYLAFSEWCISLNFQSQENDARYFLASCQQTGSQIDRMNLTIHKYNQCLQYCHQQTYDLAVIQLRKVLEQSPHLVKGHLLMALLQMREGKYDQAMESLKRVEAIDRSNPTARAYREECSRYLGRDGKVLRPKEKKQRRSLKDWYRDLQENSSMASVVNLIIGAVAGAAVVGFLVVPAIRHSQNAAQSNGLVEANATISSKAREISALNEKIDEQKQAVKDAKQEAADAQDTITSYQNLMKAYDLYRSKSYTSAGKYMEKVQRKLLDSDNKKIYDEIMAVVKTTLLKQEYNEGMTAYWQNDYKAASKSLKKVVDEEEGYDRYKAAYYLGDCYVQLKDTKQAKKYLQLCSEKSGSFIYRNRASKALKSLGSSDKKSSDTEEN